MKRTHLQLDDKLYELLRRKAFDEKSSMDAVVRRALESYLIERQTKRPSIESFTLIGSGRSRPDKNGPVSERHDDALADL